MKSIKNLLIPFIILIVLAISAIVYFVAENTKKNKPAETTGGMVDIVYYNPSDISSLSVYSRDTGHTSAVNFSIDSNDVIHYEYCGDDAAPGVNYSQSKLALFVSEMTCFSSNYKVSSDGNLSEYGLDMPACVITIKTLNGTDKTISLGNMTPDGNNCYLNIAGSTDIYLVSSSKIQCSVKTAISFLDPSVLNIDYYDIKNIHFDRKTDGLSIDAAVEIFDSGLVQFNIVKPYEHGTSSYFESLMDSVIHLVITEYVSVDNGSLSQYGLDAPVYHFVITLNNGEKTEIYFSKQINGFFYGYIAGTDKYFKLTNYQLDGIDLKETVLIDPYVCYCRINSISSITCVYGDRSFKFAMDVGEGKNIMSDGAIITLDGRNAKILDSSGRSYCSILFESIACINIGGVETDAVVDKGNGPVISLSFNGKNYVTTLYEFYERDNDSFYVFKDGEYTGFYIYSREIFNDGGYDTYSYGFWKAYELLDEAILGSIGGIYDMPN